jgi:hypothetical protein
MLMNKTVISQEALDRFRVAASEYKNVSKSRASRLLTIKDDIAALRKRGISYRAISELLIQNGIPASDTCVTNFCHRVLKEPPIRKSSAKRRASLHAHRVASPAPSPNDQPKTTLLPAATPIGNSVNPPTRTASVSPRGPRIAKVEQLPPGEKL